MIAIPLVHSSFMTLKSKEAAKFHIIQPLQFVSSKCKSLDIILLISGHASGSRSDWVEFRGPFWSELNWTWELSDRNPSCSIIEFMARLCQKVANCRSLQKFIIIERILFQTLFKLEVQRAPGPSVLFQNLK